MNSKEEVHYILHKMKSLNPYIAYIDGNRVQKSLWKTFSVSMTSILNATLELMALSCPNSYHPPALKGLTIQMMSTATILSSVIQTMISFIPPIHDKSDYYDGNLAWDGSYWSNHPFFRGNDHPTMKIDLATVIEFDTNIISQSIQNMKDCIMLNDGKNHSLEEQQQCLVLHTHRLLDVVLFYFSSFTGNQKNSYSLLSLKRNGLETPPNSNKLHYKSLLNRTQDAYCLDLTTEKTCPKTILIDKSALVKPMTGITTSQTFHQSEHSYSTTNDALRDHPHHHNSTPSIKNGKSMKVFFNTGRRSLSKSSSSSTTKSRGGLKDFFHLSNPKKESYSKRNSITSINTIAGIEQQSPSNQHLPNSIPYHDSLFLPSLPSPGKDASHGQPESAANIQSSTTYTDHEQDITTKKSISCNTVTKKQQNRSSVQLLRSPTSNNTDIRMFHDRPLSLSLKPMGQLQQSYHQQNDLPSPPLSATISKKVSSYDNLEHGIDEKAITSWTDIEPDRGRTLPSDTNANHSTQRKHRHHHLAHQRSVSPTVVSIHTEHAEPTFIRTTTQSTTATDKTQQSTNTTGVDSTHTGSSTNPPEPTATTSGVTREHLLKVNSRQGLKSYRSDSDLGRFKSFFTPSSSLANDNNGKQHTSRLADSTTVKKTMAPSPLQNSSSLHSLSSVLRPLVPQRTSSTRLNHKISHSNHDPHHSFSTTVNNKSDSSPWNLLRHVRKNSSTTSLKKAAAIQENEHYTGYGPFAENTINNSSEGSVLHLSENGQDVLIMEMVGGKFQVVAGTSEKLFIKLADETTQDFSYVDAYILNHADFTTSGEFLENLMARFHIEPQPGETDYFRKWQRCIQIKVLNVISRWLNLQFRDFMENPVLLTRLQAFINGDITRGGFMMEAGNIKELVDSQMLQHGHKRFFMIQKQLRHHHHQQQHQKSTSRLHFESATLSSTPLLSSDVKDMAQYLTLADFYLLKCITAYEYTHGNWRRKHKLKANPPNETDPGSPQQNDLDYVDLMTKRANMLGTWATNEICAQHSSRNRGLVLKKLIEIANLCLEWNNFHTSMIIVASLLQPCIQKLDEWTMVPSRILHGYHHLVKLLDVSNNMGRYRQALGKATKSPTVPFFPLLLKDMTFFMDGNQTYLPSGTTKSSSSLSPSTACSVLTTSSSSSAFSLVSSSSSTTATELINFAKYRSMTRCVCRILRATNEDYYFATDLGPWPFLRQEGGRTNSSIVDYSSSLSRNTTPLPLDRIGFLLEQSIWSTNNTQSSSAGSLEKLET